MRKSYVFVAMAASLLAGILSVTIASAQQPRNMGQQMPQGRPVGGIALLDVNAIFKEHGRFKAAMSDLEVKVKQAEEQVKQQRDTIKNLSERLKDFRAGSPEYKQIEEDVAKRTSDLQVQVALQRKEFLQQEAKIYHTVYQEIEQEVQYVATSNNIAVVLRYSGDPVDPEKPDDILRDINKSVVWYQAGLDITPILKDRLCRQSMAPAGNPGNGGGQMVPSSANRMGVPYNPQRQ